MARRKSSGSGGGNRSRGGAEDESPVQVAYQRRNRDLDPQLVWRGKDQQDWSDLVVQAPPLHVQEKVHPKALIDDLRRASRAREHEAGGAAAGLFADADGIPAGADRTAFHAHDQGWSNRMILGDSLQVMASLAEREGLRGEVQCVYLDPPYGIRFHSNFQWSTTTRDVKDGKADHVTREPEQVKAFRDTWRDGIHSYLAYLRDRLTVARDLLAETGSIFVQIGDENVHRVRALLDEVFGARNFVSLITTKKSGGMGQAYIDNISDYVVWYARDRESMKYRPLWVTKDLREGAGSRYRSVQGADGSVRPLRRQEATGEVPLQPGERVFLGGPLTSETGSDSTVFELSLEGHALRPRRGGWKTGVAGMQRLLRANRLLKTREFVNYKIFFSDFPAVALPNLWEDTMGTAEQHKVYVVQTTSKVIQRCVLMTTDPGDLVLDPTCGSGTTAHVAEQWGRRWITIDTSRVALALARARIMGARFPRYLLADSREGQLKEAELTGAPPSSAPVHADLRQGFVYERVPHVTLRSIANDAQIDVVWERWQRELEPVREALNQRLRTSWEEWEIPREADRGWPADAQQLHAAWWRGRNARQQEIDASIAARAELELLYDRPYEDRKTVRVAGPFTVESASPHRALGVDEDDELLDPAAAGGEVWQKQSFPRMVMEHLRTAGVQQAHKDAKLDFTSIAPWPGALVCAEGRYREGARGAEKRAAILIGPEFGTVTRRDLVAAAEEAAEAGFDVLVACAFQYEAHATGLDGPGRVPVLEARMNADLHMAEDLENSGKGNLFVVFGEPDIDLLPVNGDRWRVKLKGVDVFHPATGKVESSGPEGIACWFVDTDYDEESFFVRHAYFLGANDPYSALKTTLKAEIDAEAWESLHSDTSRPFPRPRSGRIAVKAINHLGDEVMKVFRVP